MTWWVVALMLTVSAEVSQTRKLYEDGDFQAAIKAAETAAPKTKDAKDLAQLHLVRGLAQLALGQKPRARAAFNDAIKADPTLELDRRIVGPDAVELIDEARAEFPSVVKVTVEGAAATVKVDGLEMGPPPLSMKLPVGMHSFEAHTNDGREVREEKPIPAASTVSVVLRVPPVGQKSEPVAKPAAPTPEPAPVVESAPPPPPEMTEQPAMQPSKAGIAPLAIGAALVVGGVVCTGLANAQLDRLEHDTLTRAQWTEAHDTGQTLQTVSYVAYGVGGAAVVAGALMLLTMKVPVESTPPVSVSFLPGGAAVSVQGRF